MENVRTFFAGQNKDGTLTNNQRNGGLNLFNGRIMPTGMSSGLQGNMSPHIGGVNDKPHHEVKRKDNDSYFYIMYRIFTHRKAVDKVGQFISVLELEQPKINIRRQCK